MLKRILLTLLGVLALPAVAYAVVSLPVQGGTGIGSATTTDIGKALIVSSTNPFTYKFGTAGSGSSTSSPFIPCAYWATTTPAFNWGSICLTDKVTTVIVHPGADLARNAHFTTFTDPHTAQFWDFGTFSVNFGGPDPVIGATSTFSQTSTCATGSACAENDTFSGMASGDATLSAISQSFSYDPSKLYSATATFKGDNLQPGSGGPGNTACDAFTLGDSIANFLNNGGTAAPGSLIWDTSGSWIPFDFNNLGNGINCTSNTTTAFQDLPWMAAFPTGNVATTGYYNVVTVNSVNPSEVATFIINNVSYGYPTTTNSNTSGTDQFLFTSPDSQHHFHFTVAQADFDQGISSTGYIFASTTNNTGKILGITDSLGTIGIGNPGDFNITSSPWIPESNNSIWYPHTTCVGITPGTDCGLYFDGGFVGQNATVLNNISFGGAFDAHDQNWRLLGSGDALTKLSSNSSVDATGTWTLMGATPPDDGAGVRMFWNARHGAFRAGGTSGNDWDSMNIGNGSAAFGVDTIAAGPESFAAGRATNVTATGSAAFGQNIFVSSTNSFAAGFGSFVMGNSSAAFGESHNVTARGDFAAGVSNRVTANFSAAFGIGNIVNNQGGFAAGENVKVGGQDGTAFGASTIASGTAAFACGSGSVAVGSASFACGPGAQVFGDDSMGFGSATVNGSRSLAFGTNLINNGNNSIMLGLGAFPLVSPTLDSNNTLNILGDDINDSGIFIGKVSHLITSTPFDPNTYVQIDNQILPRTNALTVMGGLVGIGTTTPSDQLTVTGGNILITQGNLLIPSGNINVGTGNTNSGDHSIIVGTGNNNAGVSSGIIGYNNFVTDNGSFAAGANNSSTAAVAFAMGIGNTASGIASFAFGDLAAATGNDSMAFGDGSQATADDAFAFGNNAQASALNSFSMGLGTNVSGPNSTALGINAIVSGNSSMLLAVSTTHAFTLSQDNTIALMGGNVGIGTTTPSENLTVIGSATIGDGNTATGLYSLATGFQNSAAGEGSVCLGGKNNTCDAPYSFVMGGHDQHTTGFDAAIIAGFESVASGDTCFVGAGRFNTCSNDDAAVFGSGNTASGLRSFSFGLSNVASGNDSFAAGTSMTVSGTNSFGFNLSTSTPYTVSLPNIFSIMGGSVGIGTTTPSTTLQVVGDVSITGTTTFGGQISTTWGTPTVSSCAATGALESFSTNQRGLIDWGTGTSRASCRLIFNPPLDHRPTCILTIYNSPGGDYPLPLPYVQSESATSALFVATEGGIFGVTHVNYICL